MASNRLKLNADKTQVIWIGTRQQLARSISQNFNYCQLQSSSVILCLTSALLWIGSQMGGQTLFCPPPPFSSGGHGRIATPWIHRCVWIILAPFSDPFTVFYVHSGHIGCARTGCLHPGSMVAWEHTTAASSRLVSSWQFVPDFPMTTMTTQDFCSPITVLGPGKGLCSTAVCQGSGTSWDVWPNSAASAVHAQLYVHLVYVQLHRECHAILRDYD